METADHFRVNLDMIFPSSLVAVHTTLPSSASKQGGSMVSVSESVSGSAAALPGRRLASRDCRQSWSSGPDRHTVLTAVPAVPPRDGAEPPCRKHRSAARGCFEHPCLMGAADAARAEGGGLGPADHDLRRPLPMLLMKGRSRTDDGIQGSPHVTPALLCVADALFPVCLARLHFLVSPSIGRLAMASSLPLHLDHHPINACFSPLSRPS